jgi:hypothetical protein
LATERRPIALATDSSAARSAMSEARGRLEVAMQHEGIEIRTVRPYNGPQLVVHANLRKVVRVGEWLEHRATQLSCEIDIARAAIAEANPQPVVPKHFCGRDPHEIHRFILRQRLDRLRSAATLCTGPVRFELATVQIGPLRHESERASRQSTDQYLATPNRDHRVVLGVLGMEMGGS